MRASIISVLRLANLRGSAIRNRLLKIDPQKIKENLNSKVIEKTGFPVHG